MPKPRFFLGAALCLSFGGLIAQDPLLQPQLPTQDSLLTIEQLGLHPWQDGLRGFGESYRVELSADGVRFLPDLARAAKDLPLGLRPRSVMRGGYSVCELLPSAPERHGLCAEYARAPGIRERYELTSAHLALSWTFDERPAGQGDLVVRYTLDSAFGAPKRVEDGGLVFDQPGIGGVKVGGVTGIDADGVEVAGTLRYVDGDLELRLPAAFVDEAAYPMVLDPTFGPQQEWTDGTYTCTFMDAAYDRGTDRFLLVYRKSYLQSGYSDLRGVYVTAGGAVSMPFTIAAGVLQMDTVRLANMATNGVFAIVWRVGIPGVTSRIDMATLDAGSTTPSSPMQIAFAQNFELRDFDIGCDTNAPLGSGRGFVVVYDRADIGIIYARRAFYSSNGTLQLPPATPVLTDSTSGITFDYHKPVISKAGAHAADLLLAAEVTTLGAFENIATRLLRSDSGVVLTGPTLSNIGVDRSAAEVDGYDGNWVVCCSYDDSAWASDIEATRIRFDGAALRKEASDVHDPNNSTQLPLVAYTPGRTWLAWEFGSPGANGRVRAIDSGQCVTCLDEFLLQERPTVLATMTSGGRPDGPLAISGYHDGATLYVQLARNYGLNGTVASLGGGCGNGGTPQVSHPPGVGSPGLVCRVDNLPPTALATIFNFAPPSVPIACGACEWVPFVSTLQPPIVAGSASVQFPIPCLPSLVSQQFEIQWTSFDLWQTVCPLVPGFVMSDRLLLTLGG